VRDPARVWKTFAAVLYAFLSDVLGLLLMIHHGRRSSSTVVSSLELVVAVLIAAHGKVIASYLVHEAAHASTFQEPWANAWLGTLCLWLAGCPYADFRHVKYMHMAHHKDRNDLVEFDYRTFVKGSGPVVRNLILALEWAFIPIVEIIMHCRTALYPIFCSKNVSASRRRNALVGSLFVITFYVFLWEFGALLPYMVAGTLVLQYLSMNDAFHHTYEAAFIDDYTPGPGDRTAQFEEENTYSNILSRSYPWLNLLSLNFGYHNAHHSKAMVPWYSLPEWHNELYRHKNSKQGTKDDDADEGNIKTRDSPQILSFGDLVTAWFAHRTRRVLEEDYGVVHPPGKPGRADDFVGSLGVSFLTV